MRRTAALPLLMALFVGCGDDEPAETPGVTITTTTSSSTETATTTATATETTTTQRRAGGAVDPVTAVNAVLTSEGTPEQACEQYVTPHFIETAYGGLENCIASRTEGALAGGLSLGPAIEKGATHLVVVPQGGPYDGAKVEVDLVRDADGFRVDSLLADIPAGP